MYLRLTHVTAECVLKVNRHRKEVNLSNICFISPLQLLWEKKKKGKNVTETRKGKFIFTHKRHRTEAVKFLAYYQVRFADARSQKPESYRVKMLRNMEVIMNYSMKFDVDFKTFTNWVSTILFHRWMVSEPWILASQEVKIPLCILDIAQCPDVTSWTRPSRKGGVQCPTIARAIHH